MAEQSGHEQDPRSAAEDLSEREEQRVPRTDLSQSQERERHRGVHVGAGSLAPSRVDQRNRGESHSNPAGDVAPRCAGNRPMNGRVRSSEQDRKSTRLNSSHRCISYAVFCLKKKKKKNKQTRKRQRHTTTKERM